MRTFGSRLLCVVVSAVVASPAAAAGMCSKTRDEPLLREARTTAALCARDAADRLEPSGESPQTIGQAAVARCAAEFGRVWKATERCYHSFWLPLEAEQEAVAIDNSFQSQTRNSIVGRVTERRARRVTERASAASDQPRPPDGVNGADVP